MDCWGQTSALAHSWMVYLLVRIYGLGWETADLLVHELLSRTLRDRKAVARYAGLTGSPA
jgi:transposase